MSEDLTVIRRYNSSVEAYLALGKLQSEGIEAYIADENIIDIYPGASVAFGGVRLMVKGLDASRAIRAIGNDALPEST